MLKKKRIKVLASIILFGLCILLVRLVQIQLVQTESFSKHRVNLLEESVNQRIQSFVLDDGRGSFYDRNGMLINEQEVPMLILFPFLNNVTWPIEELAEIINVPSASIKSAIELAKEPFALEKNNEILILTNQQMERINQLKVPGVFAVIRKKAIENQLAQQLIGGLTISEEVKRNRYSNWEELRDVKVGDRGLQQRFDEFLLSQGDSKLMYHVDAIGGPLFGLNVKYASPSNPLYPVKVLTTLDLGLQEAAENIVDAHKIEKGGLVLIDIDSSEIRALVSRPRVDEKNPHKGDGAKNMMLTQSTVGSVFKTVVAAASIQEDLVSNATTFNCDVRIDGSPEQDRPLGMLNFSDSFAQSCNNTFGQLAVTLAEKNPELLEQYANRLQLVGKSGWEGTLYHSRFWQLHKEEEGKIWVNDEYKKDKKLVAQTGIGQQDVQATPLSVANMMATIARGGERRMVKVVSKVQYHNLTTAAEFKDTKIEGETISPATAKSLQELLRGVVETEKGTAAMLQSLPIQIAGKTGTAQTDQENGKINMWFAGYFPVEMPKYALAVVRLDVKVDQANTSATAVFKDYVQEIVQIENSQNH